MANTYLNIITFLLTTALYYISLKPKLTYDQVSDQKEYESYAKRNYLYLGIYFLLVMVVQFGVNTSIITSTCGGSVTENLSAAGYLTFIPWSLIFGVVIMILTIYPGFKSAFSDVIGYYYVSISANKWLTELLLNQDVSNALKGDAEATIDTNATNPSAPNIEPSATFLETSVGGSKTKHAVKKGGNKSDEDRLQEAADVILKICGNTSILINQMVPDNFVQYWKLLDPLMKSQYRNNSSEGSTMREKLFDLTVTRDNIGEALWFIYTGILIISVVQMKIVTRGCQSSVAAMQQNYQQYKQQEAADMAAQQQATGTEYTITN
jgi:hypothetical protein